MNKKIFHISAHVELNTKPVWLDAFRASYDKPYPYHVSLKTMTYCDPQNINNISWHVQQIAMQYEPIEVTFSTLHVSTGSTGECIMINAEQNNTLSALQQTISKTLRTYGEHIAPAYERYESNFMPHITIGRSLTKEALEEAKKHILSDLTCVGTIRSLTLYIVDRSTPEEFLKEDNQIHFSLGARV